MDPTPLDWIMLRRDEIKAVLVGHGLHNPRIVGWAGANQPALSGVPGEIEVDMPELTDLTGGDLARLSAELTALVGVELVVWAVPVGEHRTLPGERICQAPRGA